MTLGLDYLHAALALVAVLGLLLIAGGATAWLRPRLLNAGAHPRLRIVEQRQLDPRRRLVLVRCDDIEHLLVVGPSGSQTLDRMTQASEGADR